MALLGVIFSSEIIKYMAVLYKNWFLTKQLQVKITIIEPAFSNTQSYFLVITRMDEPAPSATSAV